MHELSIARNIASIVAESAAGRPVRRVRLEVGALSGVMAEAVLFCWDVVTKGAALEGAALDVVAIAARARCRVCGEEFAQNTLYAPCPCGARDFARLSGEELNIKEMEME